MSFLKSIFGGPEREPQKKEAAPSSSPEDVEIGSKLKRLKLRQAVPNQSSAVTQANDGEGDIEAVTVEDKNKPKHSIDDLPQALIDRNWTKVAAIAYAMIFKGNNVKGLGKLAEGVEKIPDSRAKADIVEQIEGIDMENLNADEKLDAALVRTTVEYSLFREGYRRAATLQAGSAPPKKLPAGQSLEYVVNPATWEEINQQESDGKQTILGPLRNIESFSMDTYVYFAEHNGTSYPVYVSESPDMQDVPPVPLFHKKAPAVGPEGSEMDSESRVEYLESVLQPGDILFSNSRDSASSGLKNFYRSIGRLLQDDNHEDGLFFGVHGIVYKGGGMVSHVVKGGGTEESLRDLILGVKEKGGSVSGLSVSRFDMPQFMRTAFMKEAVQYVDGITGYDEGRLKKQAFKLFVSGGDAELSETGKECAVCLDVIKHAADVMSGQKDALSSEVQQQVAGLSQQQKHVFEQVGSQGSAPAMFASASLIPVVAMNFEQV